jgi:hypothetical protein
MYIEEMNAFDVVFVVGGIKNIVVVVLLAQS